MFSFFKKKSPPVVSAPIVVPRIKHTNFLVALDRIPEMPAESKPICEPLVGDLLLTYAVDLGPSYMSVSPANLTEYGLSAETLRSLATATALPLMRTLRTGTDGTIHQMTADENMVACSMLFPDLWRQVERDLGGPAVVAVPHRDAVLFARADNPAAVAALRDLLNGVDFDDTHALSKLLYEFNDGNWRVRDS